MDMVNKKLAMFEEKLDKVERFFKTKHIIQSSEQIEEEQEEENEEYQETQSMSNEKEGKGTEEQEQTRQGSDTR